MERDYKKRFQNVNEILSAITYPTIIVSRGNAPNAHLLTTKRTTPLIESGGWGLDIMRINATGRRYNISQMLQGRQYGILKMGGLNASGATHNDIVIAETSIWQATIELSSEGWTLRHGQFVVTEGQSGWFTPQNTIYLNGEEVKSYEAKKLSLGDIITIGNTTLKVVPMKEGDEVILI